MCLANMAIAFLLLPICALSMSKVSKELTTNNSGMLTQRKGGIDLDFGHLSFVHTLHGGK